MRTLLAIVISIITVAFSAESTGSIRVLVKDSVTECPISNANILVVETEKYYKTDENGYSETITSPVKRNDVSPLVPKNWGEITLIVYKDGYADAVLFNVKIKENIVRLGPTVYLTQTANAAENPKIVCESPDDKWITSLIEKYRK